VQTPVAARNALNGQAVAAIADHRRKSNIIDKSELVPHHTLTIVGMFNLLKG
jgi:hypothetical protein